MKFDVITIFPEIFSSYMSESIISRAIEKKLIKFKVWNLRDFSLDRHKKVDDRPFGGGPGMVFSVEPVDRAVGRIISRDKKSVKSRVILFSPSGKKLDDAMARRLLKYDRIVLICGRYEGVDERVAEHIADEKVSIGDYTLSGGELPAMVLIEAVSRYIPDVLGKEESLESLRGSFPAYTRPASYISKKGKRPWNVPPVLLSGDHKKIEAWRMEKGTPPEITKISKKTLLKKDSE